MDARVMDFGYLDGFAGGDRRVVVEILELFLVEAQGWRERLAGPTWRETLHTMKGAGRGVGAAALGDAYEAAERAGQEMLPQVRTALEAAVAAVESYLAAR